MFLLIPVSTGFSEIPKFSLHSTMFLLIRKEKSTCRWSTDFTFHNVSINTKTYKVGDIVNFHFTFHNVSINTWNTNEGFRTAISFTFHNVSINTMHVQSLHFAVLYFTFHNVSINTVLPVRAPISWPTLHSTMFLLIPESIFQLLLVLFFTFHNVSINTLLAK